jgi:hypothetical protein
VCVILITVPENAQRSDNEISRYCSVNGTQVSLSSFALFRRAMFRVI